MSERNLTEEEIRLRHRHKCEMCGQEAARHCYCDYPTPAVQFAMCRYRVPGERNLDCPSLKGIGGGNLTQLMREEYEKAAAV